MPLFNFNDPRFLQRRRSLRRSSTPAEVRLWGYLRQKRFCDLKFWRQYGVGPYIVDFYCPQLRLAIELDGDSHFLPGAQEYDAARQRFIESFNITVIRFLNTDIYENIDGVLQALEETVRVFYHHLSPSSIEEGEPLNREGGDTSSPTSLR